MNSTPTKLISGNKLCLKFNSYSLATVLLVFSLFSLGSCSDFKDNSEQNKVINKDKSTPTIPNTPETKGKSHKLAGDKFNLNFLVEDLLTLVLTPLINDFTESINILDYTIQNQCVLSAYTNNESQVEASVELKLKWKSAMKMYHRIEPFQIGPLTENNFEILDRIYSFPSTNYCGIDIEVYRKISDHEYQLPQATNKLGLDAIEHLLFQNDFNHGCAKKSKNLENWNQLEIKTKNDARCSYLKSISTELKNAGKELETKWNHFVNSRKELNLKNLFNDIFFAMYFIEKHTKDQVLGVPTGLSKKSASCFGRFCPKHSEHKTSNFTKKQLLANIETLDSLFSGRNSEKQMGFGIYDLLESKKEKLSSKVSNKIKNSLSFLLNKIASLPEDFNVSNDVSFSISYEKCKLSNKNERHIESCSLYYDLRELTQLLKIDLPVALSVKLPVDTEGDGD